MCKHLLPALGLVETPQCVRDDGRELIRRESGLSNVLVESGRLFKSAALLLLRVDNANGLPILADAQLDWRCQVTVA